LYYQHLSFCLWTQFWSFKNGILKMWEKWKFVVVIYISLKMVPRVPTCGVVFKNFIRSVSVSEISHNVALLLHSGRYLVFYVLLFTIFAFTVLLAFNPAYTQLSKYAMTVTHRSKCSKRTKLHYGKEVITKITIDTCEYRCTCIFLDRILCNFLLMRNRTPPRPFSGDVMYCLRV